MAPLALIVNLATNFQSQINKFFIRYIHHHISLLVNLHVGHLIGHIHDKQHNFANIISISITNLQSLISKVFSSYLHSSGSHQSTRFLESVTHTITSRASCGAKNHQEECQPPERKEATMLN